MQVKETVGLQQRGSDLSDQTVHQYNEHTIFVQQMTDDNDDNNIMGFVLLSTDMKPYHTNIENVLCLLCQHLFFFRSSEPINFRHTGHVIILWSNGNEHLRIIM